MKAIPKFRRATGTSSSCSGRTSTWTGGYSRYMLCFIRLQGRQRRPCNPYTETFGAASVLLVSAARDVRRVQESVRAGWMTALIATRATGGQNHDVDVGYGEYRGAGTLNVKKAKNDQRRSGCRRWFGRPQDPDLD